MTMTMTSHGDTDYATTIAAGMHDDTLPLDWQHYAAQPDWVIRQAADPMPTPPEDDGMAPTAVLELRPGVWGPTYQVVETYNMEPRMLGKQLATRLDAEILASVATGLDERDTGAAPWQETLPRFARIFWDLVVVVYPGPGNYWYVSVITPTWADAVGVEATPAAMKWGNYDEVTGWLNGEASYLELATWDPILEEYVTDDIVGGFYGEVDVNDALDAFGK